MTCDLLHAHLDEMRPHVAALDELIGRVQERTDWPMPFAYRPPAACFYDGAFFSAVGENFDHPARSHDIINADEFDAWFPPAPGVLAALHEQLPWLLRASPPTSSNVSSALPLIDFCSRATATTPSTSTPSPPRAPPHAYLDR